MTAPSPRRSGRIPLAVLLLLSLGLTACTNVFVPNSASSATSYQYLTGNWQFTLTPTQGPVPFPTLAGFLEEQPIVGSTKDFLISLTQIEQPGPCYPGATALPLQGNVDGTAITLFSFSFDGQYVSINAAKNTAATTLTGTYSVGNGCADGDAGTIAGTRYAALSGLYSGAATLPSQKLALTLTQATLGNADGTTNVSGSATFTGISCFSAATVTGTVLGQALHLTLLTNEPGGSQLTLTGTFDPAATVLQAATLQVTGGSCAGSLGTATLIH